MLLASLSKDPKNLSWTDTSTGQIVGNFNYGPLRETRGLSYKPNVRTGVVSSCHANGVVAMWSPCTPKPLAMVFCHEGGVDQMVNSVDGWSFVTSGLGKEIKVWDWRMLKCRGIIRTEGNVGSLDLSQRGLLGCGIGGEVVVYKEVGGNKFRKVDGGDGKGEGGRSGEIWGTRRRLRGGPGGKGALYMRERYGERKRMRCVRFCPFEDVLGVCMEDELRTMIVPGAGEGSFDKSGPHPYEGKKERREKEIRSLLDKLPPETISLDSRVVGGVEKDAKARLEERKMDARKKMMEKKMGKVKKKTKGRNKIGKRLKRKQANVMDAKKAELLEKLEREKREAREKRKKREEEEEEDEIEPALQRFAKR